MFRRIHVLLTASALALAGCGGTLDLPDVLDRVTAPKAEIASGGELSQTAPLGGIVVAGAPDECLLPEATAQTGSVASATLANCEAIAKSPDPATYPGFTTVTVTKADPPQTEADRQAISQFLLSAAGARSVARNPGQPVTIHGTQVTKAAVYVDVTDPAVPPGIAQRYWRAIVGIEGKLVTVSRYAPADTPSATSIAAIRTAVQHVIDAN